MRYLIRRNGAPYNVILWDGTTPLALPEGDTIEPEPEGFVMPAAPPTVRDQLDAMWAQMAAALPLSQRAHLRAVKMTVVDAMNASAWDEVSALIEAQPVPPEFEATKAQALAMLQGES